MKGTIKRRAKGMIGCLLCVLLLLTAAVPTMAEDDTAVLRVAFYPLDGFFEYDAAGQPIGYGVELLNKITEYTGIQFAFVAADTWEQTKQMLLAGEADIRMPGTKPAATSKTLGYTNESVMDSYRAVMTLKSRDDLYYKDYENFSVLTIAVTRSLYENANVRAYLDSLGIRKSNLALYDEYALCRQALDSGAADAVISSIMDLTDELKVLARFDSVPNYVSMTIGNPYLDVLDVALNEIKMDDPSFLPLLYQQFYPERTLAPYTRQEAEYVKNVGVITVGQLAGREPLSYLDAESGRITGMFVDLCDLIATKSGLTFRYELLEIGERGVDWLKATDGKLVAGVMYSPLTSPSTELAHSDTAFPTSAVVVGRAGESFSPNGSMTIAVPSGYIGGQEYIASAYPNAKIKLYNTNEACLDAILGGSADILLQNLYVIRSALQSPRYDTLEIFPVYQTEENMKLVMLASEDALLMSVINKAIDSITDEELNDIVVAHSIAKPYRITLRDILYKYRMPIRIIAVMLLMMIGLFALIVVIRHRNTRRLQAKNLQLEEAYEQARAASRAKGEFLARMSHEIRTPLNAILGMTTLAADHIGEPTAIKADLDKVALSSRMLLSIVNDVLDVSAIESGKLKLGHAPFDFWQLLASLDTVYEAQCGAKGLRFRSERIGAVDEWLVGDPLRINQILMNLLSNAVKFTDAGEVSLLVEQKADAAGEPLPVFTVADTGCGMEEDMLERLWQPFEQESAHTALEHGGSGLGLSIAKSLVTLMGGSIRVRSKKGAGTVFTVELPCGRCAESERKPAKTLLNHGFDFTGRRVLMAEDNDMNRIVGVGLLKKAHIDCETAANGKIALEMFIASEAGYYDAVLMDVQMPVMDGCEAARAIRAGAHPCAGTIPIIAMTANAFTEDIAVCLQSGMDAHVAKPIEPDVLWSTLEWAFNGKEGNV